MVLNFKVPPSLEQKVLYNAQLKETNVWQAFTDNEKNNQEPAVFYTTGGKTRKTILELDIDENKSESGVENNINCLDNL